MVSKAVLAAIALALGTPAIAGTPLWGKIEADMPFADAAAAYPEGHVNTGKGLFRPMITLDQEIDGCKLSVWILIDRKTAEPGAKVDSVYLSGEKCDAKMFNNLLAKYGEPMALNDDNDDKKKTARWVKDGRSIVYKRTAGDGFASDRWEITYSAVKDLGL